MVTKIQKIRSVSVLLLYSSRVFRFGSCSAMQSASRVIKNTSLRVVDIRTDTSSLVGRVWMQLWKWAPTGLFLLACSSSRTFRCRSVFPTQLDSHRTSRGTGGFREGRAVLFFRKVKTTRIGVGSLLNLLTKLSVSLPLYWTDIMYDLPGSVTSL